MGEIHLRRLLMVPPFRGSSGLECLILAHHSGSLHVSVMERTLMMMMMEGGRVGERGRRSPGGGSCRGG